MFLKGSDRLLNRAWVGLWAVWVVVSSAWFFLLPWAQEVVSQEAQRIRLVGIGMMCVVMILALVILGLMLLSSRVTEKRLLAPLVAILALLLIGAFAPSPFEVIEPAAQTSLLAMPPVVLGLSFFSIGAPFFAFTVALSVMTGGLDPLSWHLILFLCLTIITVVPVWLATLTAERRSSISRKIVFGLFFAYWLYVLLGFLYVAWIGTTSLFF
ncbi:MAG: hypothetical protein RL141_753 [Candidatus Parcubacteria bacterium]|jgi:hypothetical protein